MVKAKFYRCIRKQQYDYFTSKGFTPVSEHVNERGYAFWVFEITPEFEEVLEVWENSEQYVCYSINLLRYLLACGHKPYSKSTHKVTGRDYWCFIVNDEFSKSLTVWTANKSKN